VVDVDLEKFFDRVNHDILIDRLQKRIPDAGLIRLIRAYLNSGIMHSCRYRPMDDGHLAVQRRIGLRSKAGRAYALLAIAAARYGHYSA
jgi:hypothetical protein